MFYPVLKQERIKFLSNPPVGEKPQIVPVKDFRGNFRNELKMQPSSNKPDQVVHYDSSSMSLRAMLNLGVQFSEVSIGQIENDPIVLQQRALAMEHSIESRLNDLKQDLTPPDVVENS